MRIAALRRPDGSRALIDLLGSRGQLVDYDAASGAWSNLGRLAVGEGRHNLEAAFAPCAVIAPGPRIDGPAEWLSRHREFHVKPASVMAHVARSEPSQRRSLAYRIQAGLVFRPTERGTPAAAILEQLIGCHMVMELIDVDALRVDWEGPRWHIRYGEGMAFDGACRISPILATPDEFPADGIDVEHASGPSVLAWQTLAGFAAEVNRYLELGPQLMLLAGWDSGPTLSLVEGQPQLTFDGPRVSAGADAAWCSNDVLGRVELALEAAA